MAQFVGELCFLVPGGTCFGPFDFVFVWCNWQVIVFAKVAGLHICDGISFRILEILVVAEVALFLFV
jgi:hypothetical protein